MEEGNISHKQNLSASQYAILPCLTVTLSLGRGTLVARELLVTASSMLTIWSISIF